MNLLIGLLLLSGVAIAKSSSITRVSKENLECVYPCLDLETAFKCNSAHHCINSVWLSESKFQNLAQDDDDVCTICKNMVEEARDQLESNETQLEILAVFDGSCDLIPLKIIAYECKKLFDGFVPQLIETLSSEMNPQLVCATAGLCNSMLIDRMLSAVYSVRPKTNCQYCMTEARKFKNNINGLRIDQIVSKLLELCGRLSSFSDGCNQIVEENIHEIISTIRSPELDTGLCYMSGYCSDERKDEIADISTAVNSGDVQCEFCEKVIQHWKDTWTANTTEEEFKNVMEAICRRFDDKQRTSQCLHIVDQYYIPIFEFVAHSLKPDIVCKLFGLCTDGGQFMQLNPRSSIFTSFSSSVLDGSEQDSFSIESNEMMTGNEIESEWSSNAPLNAEDMIGGYFGIPNVISDQISDCALCELVLYNLLSMPPRGGGANVRSNLSVQESFDDACRYVSYTLKEQCDLFVTQYKFGIVELLYRDIDRNSVCPLLTDSCFENLRLGRPQDEHNLIGSVNEEPTCALCQYVVHYLYSFIENKSNVQEIENVLETLCSRLPSHMEGRCNDLVETYTDKIISILTQGLTPDQLCIEISLCKATKHYVVPVESAGCVICEFVISKLDEMLDDKGNEEKIRSALDRVCNYLPKTVTKDCLTYVDTYSEMIIDFLTHGFSPKQVCLELKLCGEEIFEYVRNDIAKGSEQRGLLAANFQFCQLCQNVVETADIALLNNKTDLEVRKETIVACKTLQYTNEFSDSCVYLVNMYWSKIVAAFDMHYSPIEVCLHIGLCSPAYSYPELGSSPSDESVIDNSEEVVETSSTPPLCIFCEMVMSILEKTIVNERTIDMIERSVHMICSYMPDKFANSCSDFIDEYGDEIIHLLLSEALEPKEICSALTICPQVTLWDASVYGGRPCIWGPAFWCRSHFHAMTCGTTSYCIATNKLD